MIDVVDPLNGLLESHAVKDVAVDDFDGEILQPCRAAGCAEETADGVALLKEKFHEVTADEAAGSGDECVHSVPFD